MGGACHGKVTAWSLGFKWLVKETYLLFCLSFPSFSLVMNWRFTRGVEEQTKSFMDGFNEIVPLEWINIFDEKELEVRGCVRGEEMVVGWDSMHCMGSKICHPSF